MSAAANSLVTSPPEAPSDAFEQAVLDSKKLVSLPSNEDLLELYALYKVARFEDYSQAATPGLFDIKGKAKKAAWKRLLDEGVLPLEAQNRYVQKVTELKLTCGYNAAKEPEAVGTA